MRLASASIPRQIVDEDGFIAPIKLMQNEMIYNPKVDENIQKSSIKTAVNIDEAMSGKIKIFDLDDEIGENEIDEESDDDDEYQHEDEEDEEDEEAEGNIKTTQQLITTARTLQPDLFSCGVFAPAYATTIILGYDPT